MPDSFGGYVVVNDPTRVTAFKDYLRRCGFDIQPFAAAEKIAVVSWLQINEWDSEFRKLSQRIESLKRPIPTGCAEFQEFRDQMRRASAAFDRLMEFRRFREKCRTNYGCLMVKVEWPQSHEERPFSLLPDRQSVELLISNYLDPLIAGLEQEFIAICSETPDVAGADSPTNEGENGHGNDSRLDACGHAASGRGVEGEREGAAGAGE